MAADKTNKTPSVKLTHLQRNQLVILMSALQEQGTLATTTADQVAALCQQRHGFTPHTQLIGRVALDMGWKLTKPHGEWITIGQLKPRIEALEARVAALEGRPGGPDVAAAPAAHTPPTSVRDLRDDS